MAIRSLAIVVSRLKKKSIEDPIVCSPKCIFARNLILLSRQTHNFWLRQELKKCNVRSFDENLSRALNLHLSGSGLGLSQVSLRSVLGLP